MLSVDKKIYSYTGRASDLITAKTGESRRNRFYLANYSFLKGSTRAAKQAPHIGAHSALLVLLVELALKSISPANHFVCLAPNRASLNRILLGPIHAPAFRLRFSDDA